MIFSRQNRSVFIFAFSVAFFIVGCKKKPIVVILPSENVLTLPAGAQKKATADPSQIEYALPFSNDSGAFVRIEEKPYKMEGPFFEWFYAGGLPQLAGVPITAQSSGITSINGRPAAQWILTDDDKKQYNACFILDEPNKRVAAFLFGRDGAASFTADSQTAINNILNQFKFKTEVGGASLHRDAFQKWSTLAHFGRPSYRIDPDRWWPYIHAHDFVFWIPAELKLPSKTRQLPPDSTWISYFEGKTGDGWPIFIHIANHRGAGSDDPRTFIEKNDALKIIIPYNSKKTRVLTEVARQVAGNNVLEQEVEFEESLHRALILWFMKPAQNECVALVFRPTSSVRS